MSNRYWGWGREDDELYVRLKKAILKVSIYSKVPKFSDAKNFAVIHLKFKQRGKI